MTVPFVAEGSVPRTRRRTNVQQQKQPPQRRSVGLWAQEGSYPSPSSKALLLHTPHPTHASPPSGAFPPPCGRQRPALPGIARKKDAYKLSVYVSTSTCAVSETPAHVFHMLVFPRKGVVADRPSSFVASWRCGVDFLAGMHDLRLVPACTVAVAL